MTPSESPFRRYLREVRRRRVPQTTVVVDRARAQLERLRGEG